MKLPVKEFSKKDGSKGYAVKIRRLDPTGKGMALGDELRIQLSFPPSFREMTSKKGQTFTAINVLGKWLNCPEDYKKYAHPDFGSHSFDFPSGKYVLEPLKGAQADDTVVLYLESYNTPQGDEALRWNVEVHTSQGESTESNQNEAEIPFS
jgi:hypothetical protein